jgi:hypothetical protein
MRPITLSRALVAAAAGAVCASQTTAGAGNLLINGTLASGGVATLDTQRNVGITSAGNVSAVTFTITGTDQQNRVISESLAGPNANTVTSVLNYKTVTSIAVSAAVASNVTVDTLATGASQEIPLDRNLNPFNVSISGEILSGAVNWSIQYTFDDIFASAGPFNWYNHSTLVNQAVSANGTILSPVRAIRVVTNSGTGTLSTQVVQSGLVS